MKVINFAQLNKNDLKIKVKTLFGYKIYIIPSIAPKEISKNKLKACGKTFVFSEELFRKFANFIGIYRELDD